MTVSRLEQDIKAQAASLAGVLQHQFGAGAGSIEQAASLLRQCPKVVISGMGASLYAALPLKYALCARGIAADVVEAGELLHFLHPAYRDALLIIVSRSGESVEVAKLLAIAAPGQKIIGVTNEPSSLLAKKADFALQIGSLADEMVAIQSYTGTLLTLHVLAAAVEDRLAACARDLSARIPQLAQLVEGCIENRQLWDDFLDPERPVYLLARGPSIGSALEGALLFNEVAKHSAIGMPMASFRHGPVEVVDDGFRGVVFAPEAPTRVLNLALAQDLKEFGGRVMVIGPGTDEGADLRWAVPPASPEALAPLFEIVPIQVAAFRMAELHGIRPGSFRYAPQVTTDEARFSRR